MTITINISLTDKASNRRYPAAPEAPEALEAGQVYELTASADIAQAQRDLAEFIHRFRRHQALLVEYENSQSAS